VIRFLADENFNRNIIRGLLRRTSQAEIVVAQDVSLTGADDEVLLAWAAQNGLVVLTHDAATVVRCAFDRLEAGLPMPGILQVSARLPVGHAIEELVLICECSDAEEWTGVVRYIPL